MLNVSWQALKSVNDFDHCCGLGKDPQMTNDPKPGPFDTGGDLLPDMIGVLESRERDLRRHGCRYPI